MMALQLWWVNQTGRMDFDRGDLQRKKDGTMPHRAKHMFPAGTVLAVFLVTANVAAAQDLEPRAFAPAPKGLNFAVVAYGYSAGNILFDPVLPISGAEGKVHSATLAYVRTLALFGKSAKLAAIAPYAWGDWSGDIDGQRRTRSATGLADPALQLTVNFVGAPAFSSREMVSYTEGTIVGMSLLVKLPLGQYDPDRLVNLGSNRWVLAPRLGISHRLDQWTFEAIGSVHFYSDNNDAFQDTELSQTPLWGLVLDSIYQFRRGMWFGFGGGVGAGARTTISGVPKDTYQRNIRVGFTFAYPLSPRTSLKIVYVHSPKTERGADFDTLSLAWQMRWGGGI